MEPPSPEIEEPPPSMDEYDESFALDEFELDSKLDPPPSYLDVWKEKLELSKDKFAVLTQSVTGFHERRNDSASLPFNEFTELIHTAGIEYEQENDLHHLFSYLDIDGNGDLEVSEFLTGMSMLLVDIPFEERLRFTFTAFDLDGNSNIDREELYKLLVAVSNTMKRNIHVEEHLIAGRVDEIFEKYDTDRNGVLSFEEFSTAARSDSELGLLFTVSQYMRGTGSL